MPEASQQGVLHTQLQKEFYLAGESVPRSPDWCAGRRHKQASEESRWRAGLLEEAACFIPGCLALK